MIISNTRWETVTLLNGIVSIDPTLTPPSITQPSASATNDDDDRTGGGITTGAVAGGAVGGVVALGLLAGLAFFLLRRRRRKQDLKQEKGKDPESHLQVVVGRGPIRGPGPSWDTVPGSPVQTVWSGTTAAHDPRVGPDYVGDIDSISLRARLNNDRPLVNPELGTVLGTEVTRWCDIVRAGQPSERPRSFADDLEIPGSFIPSGGPRVMRPPSEVYVPLTAAQLELQARELARRAEQTYEPTELTTFSQFMRREEETDLFLAGPNASSPPPNYSFATTLNSDGTYPYPPSGSLTRSGSGPSSGRFLAGSNSHGEYPRHAAELPGFGSSIQESSHTPYNPSHAQLNAFSAPGQSLTAPPPNSRPDTYIYTDTDIYLNPAARSPHVTNPNRIPSFTALPPPESSIYSQRTGLPRRDSREGLSATEILDHVTGKNAGPQDLPGSSASRAPYDVTPSDLENREDALARLEGRREDYVFPESVSDWSNLPGNGSSRRQPVSQPISYAAELSTYYNQTGTEQSRAEAEERIIRGLGVTDTDRTDFDMDAVLGTLADRPPRRRATISSQSR